MQSAWYTWPQGMRLPESPEPRKPSMHTEQRVVPPPPWLTVTAGKAMTMERQFGDDLGLASREWPEEWWTVGQRTSSKSKGRLKGKWSAALVMAWSSEDKAAICTIREREREGGVGGGGSDGVVSLYFIGKVWKVSFIFDFNILFLVDVYIINLHLTLRFG